MENTTIKLTKEQIMALAPIFENLNDYPESIPGAIVAQVFRDSMRVVFLPHDRAAEMMRVFRRDDREMETSIEQARERLARWLSLKEMAV